MTNQHTNPLTDAVVAIAGAGGGAGAAVAEALADAGATVLLSDTDLDRLAPVVESVRARGGNAEPVVVDLLDEEAVREWLDEASDRLGRLDGMVHLVGGWRGGTPLAEADLGDWDALEGPLVRTVLHTTRASQEALSAGPAGRFALVSSIQASRPTQSNAVYATAKAAAEAWTLAFADALDGSSAAASILVVKALLTPAMRAAKPAAAFAGYTPVGELAEQVVALWDRPAADVNGQRIWLTEER